LADVTKELERGRQCYAQKKWGAAYGFFARADRTASHEPEDLERLTWTAALTGRDADFLALLERLYTALVAAEQGARAARAAFWLGFRLLTLGEPARGTGWLARAGRLVEREARACAEQGYLLIPLAQRHLVAGEYDEASAVAAQAAAIGERFSDADLEALARNLHGGALMRRRDVGSGLRLLDEAMVAASTGDLSPLVTGLVYCSMIASCQHVFALDRAREWTAALANWCDAQPELVTFTGRCLVYRAEVMALEGAWS